MDQFDLNKLKNTFSSLIRGTKTGQEEYETLNTLLASYPYCQPLQIIRAAAERNNPDASTQQLSKAAVYTPDRNVLYKFIYEPEQFYKGPSDPEPTPFAEETVEFAPGKTAEPEIIENREPELLEDPAEAIDPAPEGVEAEHEKEAEIVYIETAAEEELPIEVEADDPPIFDNIASSDYFTFNKSTADPLTRQQEAPETPSYSLAPSEGEDLTSSAAAHQNVTRDNLSKYYDEELPYTFLWWLQKTRKEHAHTYQPYAALRPQASEALRKTSADELNHQIIENIFHLQVPIQDEKGATSANTVEFELRRQGKKEYLIEKFIKEEPQIRPPKGEKIDTENKARKSSEDNLDLVSETLAQIYIEQMLYHKAIDTYRKLSLKFPEKSTYFADQINEIQKKIS